jgi:large subunit ribosomal protein L4
MAKAKLYTGDGSFKSDIELPDSYFNQPVMPELIHFYVTLYSGNQRKGTSKTKGRSDVSGSGKKPWRQKGTGRSRSGTNTSPVWVRGGKAHGAQPRSYHRKLNKNVRQKALLSALSAKAGENSIHVFEGFSLSAPRTKELTGILDKASLLTNKMSIFISEPDVNLFLAARNIPSVRIGRVQDINAYEVMDANSLVFTQSALKTLTQAKD